MWEMYILEVDAEVVLRVGLSIFDSPRNWGLAYNYPLH